MSTELKKPFDECNATRFSGGVERGVCIQLTKREGDYGTQHVTFTKAEAMMVASTFMLFTLGLEVAENE